MFKNAACASYARATLAAALGGAAILIWSSALYAAEAKKDDVKKEDVKKEDVKKEGDDPELTEVTVTGTRILSPNATSANPITTITKDEMDRLGIVNVADALTMLVPQNISTYMPALVGDTQMDGQQGGGMERGDRGAFFIGNTIANLRGMDPTFGSRTLTLVDGRRVVSTSNQADVVDLNIIPSNLLERMDVVTGGASATYGSGAMAGVVNLVLNRRLNGIRLDMDYGVSEAGDGGNPHISLSGGTSLLGGKGHILLGLEWRTQHPIRDCAAARDWCAESRTTFDNTTGGSTSLTGPVQALDGFAGYPRRFQMANVRYSQFSPTGGIALPSGSTTATTFYKFDEGADSLTGLLSGDNAALGYRGGTSTSNIMNGDGPLATSGQTLRPSNETRSVFANFDYDITPTTTASLQATYATTDALNKNRYTTGTYCTRFDSLGTRGTAPAPAGTVWTFGTTFGTVNGVAYAPARTALLNPPTQPVAAFLGMVFQPGTFVTDPTFTAPINVATSYISGGYNPYTSINGGAVTPGIAWPWWVPVELSPNAPNFDFGGHAVGHWVKLNFTAYSAATRTNPATGTNFAAGPNTTQTWNNAFWVLDTITLTTVFDSGTPTTNPQLGRNAYAFLQNMAPDAFAQVQNAFGNVITAGSGGGGSSASALGGLYGDNPCNGYTAIRKVWNPQLQQTTHSETERYTVQGSIRGRFGGDWRWDANLSHGSNDSKSNRTNIATNLRSAFAMDAVIDDRATLVVNGQVVNNPTYGIPICRITRDGPPILDTVGRPLSGAESLANLARNCQPLNVFGNVYSNNAFFNDLEGNRFLDPNGNPITYDAAAIQQQALDYSFVDSGSSGTTSQESLSLTTSGTLWQGWAGPLRGALSLDINQNSNTNAGSKGDFYTRADLGSSWADAFGGKTRQYEPSLELSLPLVSGLDGINLLSVSGTYRYGLYYVKGGSGTTGEHSTQKTPTWRFSAEFSPFDWARFRMTRSKDMRAAGYRELFIYQPGQPDQFTILNPWRERTATSTENQNERYGQVQVGNPDLKPERSSTLTMGLVLSPGGWAQGMRMSIDYSTIRIRDGISLPFNANMPVQTCFDQSLGRQPTYLDGELIDDGDQTAFDEENPYCKQLRFAQNPDGSRNLQDLISYTSASYSNGLPYQNRSVDLSWNYNFPLSRAFESLPGSLSLTVRGSRALEASGVQQTSSFGAAPSTQACGAKFERADAQNYTLAGVFRVVNSYTCVNLVGQIRSSTFIPGVAASPKWRGNMSASYLYGNLTTTLAAQYTGAAKVDVTWVDDPEDPRYYARDSAGNVLLGVNGQPQLSNATVDDNRAKAYVNLSLNGQYNLKVANMQQFQIFGSIQNLMDKDPPFVSGGVGGASGSFSDTFGRAYRLGVRLRF